MTNTSKLSIIVICILVSLLGFTGYQFFRDMRSPELVFSHQADTVSPNLPLTITAADAKSGIKRITIVARLNENELPVVEEIYTQSLPEQSLTFTLAGAGVKHGDVFDLEITAVDDSFGGFGFGNKERLILPMRLDSIPPRISVLSSSPYVRKGGTGCLVYSVSKNVHSSGVTVGEYHFPAFRQENGDFICFFAFPWHMEINEFKPQLYADDEAGNSALIAVDINPMERRFREDTIAISQGFLDAKAGEFQQIFPGDMTEIERYIRINADVRKDNAKTLLEIGKDTDTIMLWKGAFLRLPRAASRAGFADARTYTWEGETIDRQTHLGFDLASVKQAPVPASNHGLVVYAGYLGIYGNLIVIDHGLGLQSLYSHLSEISVEEGQEVNKGDIIAKTGSTGMAYGDHLHFGILVSGLEVTPLEWLDDHWIKDNVVDRINAAGAKAPEISISPSPTMPKPSRRR